MSPADAFAALEATWPPARWHIAEGWRVAEGQGGGKRVSAARATLATPDIQAMEALQARLGQPPLVMIGPDESLLDTALADRGYARIDPTRLLSAPVDAMAQEPPPVTAFEVAWPPLIVQEEIWEAGGIGAARRAVMARVTGPKATFLGRRADTPCASVFVACDGPVAMVHALEVALWARRHGIARHLMQAAALWAGAQGAATLAALVTEANAAANALYRGLGMAECARYHYRGLRKETP